MKFSLINKFRFTALERPKVEGDESDTHQEFLYYYYIIISLCAVYNGRSTSNRLLTPPKVLPIISPNFSSFFFFKRNPDNSWRTEH